MGGWNGSKMREKGVGRREGERARGRKEEEEEEKGEDTCLSPSSLSHSA